jgi:hypothetical protein
VGKVRSEKKGSGGFRKWKKRFLKNRNALGARVGNTMNGQKLGKIILEKNRKFFRAPEKHS